MKYMQSGKGNNLLNPSKDWVWHHPASNPDVMHLIPKSQHRNSLYQPFYIQEVVEDTQSSIKRSERMKSVEDIIKRSVALLSFCDRCAHEEEYLEGRFYSLEMRENQRKIVYDWIVRIGYDSYLTDIENELFQKPVSVDKDTYITSKSVLYECLEPLLWSIGLEKKISNYDNLVLKDFHSTLMIGRYYDLNKLMQKAKLVDIEEIKRQRDIAMLWNWRAKTFGLQLTQDIDNVISKTFNEDLIKITKIKLTKESPKDFIALNKPYHLLANNEVAQLEQIALWRQHALEWILSEEEWDNVPISV